MKNKKSAKLIVEYYAPSVLASLFALGYVIAAVNKWFLLTMKVMLHFCDKLFNMSNVLFGFILALVGIFFSIKTGRLMRELKAEGYHEILRSYVEKACVACGMLSLYCLTLNLYELSDLAMYIKVVPSRGLLIALGAVFVYLVTVVLLCVFRLVKILCKTM